MPSLRETLRGHVRGGHEVVVLMPKFQLFEERPKVVAVRDDEGYEVRLVPCRWVPPFLWVRRGMRWFGGGKELLYPLRWLMNLGMCVLLTVSLLVAALRLRYREKQRFDLVYAHNQYAALAGWCIARMSRVPNVTRLYGTFLADLMKRRWVRLRYPVAAAGFLVPHSLVICANDGTRGDEVARKLGIDLSRFRFWQNGVDLPDRPPEMTRNELVSQFSANGLRRDAKWVLSCSRVSYWKRIDRMIRALKHAQSAGCDCQLVVAGDGSERPRLTQLAEELGIAADVIWLGAVAHDRIWALMNLADVFMITNDVTNRCNPVYEAICAHLPVVSVKDPSTADLLKSGDNALLADREDTEALGENLFRVCSDDALATSMRHAQEARRKLLWSWEERMAVEVGELEALVQGAAVAATGEA